MVPLLLWSCPQVEDGPICYGCIQETRRSHLREIWPTIQQHTKLHQMQDRLQLDRLSHCMSPSAQIRLSCSSQGLKLDGLPLGPHPRWGPAWGLSSINLDRPIRTLIDLYKTHCYFVFIVFSTIFPLLEHFVCFISLYKAFVYIYIYSTI